MAQQATDKTLSKAKRLEIFRALVEAQDGGMAPALSREVVAGRFDISEWQLRRIEKEGLDGDWPPL